MKDRLRQLMVLTSAFALIAIALALLCAPSRAWAQEVSPEGLQNESPALAAADPDESQDSSLSEGDKATAGEISQDTGTPDANLQLASLAQNDNAGTNAAVTTASTTVAAKASSVATATTEAVKDTGVTMYRLYNRWSGEHLYTKDASERDFLSKIGWKNEGVGWIAPSSGDPVYRLYNPYSGDHHYTLDVNEYNYLGKIGWRKEGLAWYSGGQYKVYRQFNPYEQIGTHNYTCSKSENDYLASIGWRAEGIGWHALADSVASLQAMMRVDPSTTNFVGYQTYRTDLAARARIDATDGSTAVIDSSYVSGMHYLLLPSYADLTALKLSALLKSAESSILLSSSEAGEYTSVPLGDSVDVTALSTSTSSNGAKLLWFRTSSTSQAYCLGIMKSAELSAVYVNSVSASQGRKYVDSSQDHSAKANVTITVVDSDGSVTYNGDTASKPATIKGRGNSTWNDSSKKPYQISLSKKSDLLGTTNANNAQKKWLLLADSDDVTMLHNLIALNLGLEAGLVGTECVSVDLYYDGEYRGTYLLCEKIQINGGRVNIDDLEDAIEAANPGKDLSRLATAIGENRFGKKFRYVVGVANPSNITGGYLVELDEAYYYNEVCWFETQWNHFVVKSPEYCSYEAMYYISECFEAAIRHIKGQSTGNIRPEINFDLDSLAMSYIISEYTKNIDFFITSTYFYKDKDSNTIKAQPLWDFDSSMGVRTDWSDWSFATYHGVVLPHASTWFRGIETILSRARQLWSGAVEPLVNNYLLSNDVDKVGPKGFLHTITYYRQRIAASQKMNQVLFGLTALGNEFKPFSTYDLNYNYLQNWLTWRSAWMHDNIGRVSGQLTNAPWSYGGVDYSLVFDASYYKKQNGLNGYTDAQAIQHFVNTGMANGLVASRNFNVAVYKASYPDLVAAYGNNLKQYYLHYIRTGFKEGRVAV